MREAHDPFPLTPALSLGERENRRQSVGESETAGIFEDRTSLHPLPEGEGRGEGEQCLGTGSRLDVTKLHCHCTRTTTREARPRTGRGVYAASSADLPTWRETSFRFVEYVS